MHELDRLVAPCPPKVGFMIRKLWSRAKAAPLLSLIALVPVLGIAAAAGLYAYAGVYGLNVVLRRGGSVWHATSADDAALSPSMRLALRGNVPAVAPGALAWRRLADGFEVGELPVLLDGKEVDRLLLARIAPARFRFEVHNRPAGDREPADWLTATGAVFVINGSYLAAKASRTRRSRAAARSSGRHDTRRATAPSLPRRRRQACATSSASTGATRSKAPMTRWSRTRC
jgi:hypothetical protein